MKRLYAFLSKLYMHSGIVEMDEVVIRGRTLPTYSPCAFCPAFAEISV